MEDILYIKGNDGNLRYWVARETHDGIEIEYGVLGGSAQYQYESIDFGKAGRSVDEQISSRINSRYNKQLDKGYTRDIEKAKSMKAMNRLGFAKPMLAKKYEDVDIRKLMIRQHFIQNKLDGNRCLIHNDGNRIIAYTRNGKEFTTLKHITDLLEDVIPVGDTLDGELYIHGVSLQTIVSWAKRLQPDTLKLQYHVYDMISDEPFSVRNNRLGAILRERKDTLGGTISLVPTIALAPTATPNLTGILGRLEAVRALGYEGLMFRSDWRLDRGVLITTPYEDGKRSGSLIKIKEWDNKEYKIIDVKASADDWAVLVCENPIGPNFTVSCPGDIPFKRSVLNSKEFYIGKNVTVRFAYLTADKVPFHPVSEAIRDYE
jgi:DNA ligase 1